MKQVSMEKILEMANSFDEWDIMGAEEYAQKFLDYDLSRDEELKEYHEMVDFGFESEINLYRFVKAFKEENFDLYAEDEDAIIVFDAKNHKIVEYQK